MRILVISDIHANLSALLAVLKHVNDFDTVWCLGDLVGYGPDPNESIEIVKHLPNLTCILGNHDAAAINKIDISSFNPEARASIEWTRSQLTKDSYLFLASLPQKVEIDGITLTHGSPRSPIWEYLLDALTATQNFDYFETPYCFVGHSHLPVIFSLNQNNPYAQLTVPIPGEKLQLTPRMILNPGSVGQPRDHNPKAAFAIYDNKTNEWFYDRVPYDIDDVQKRMKQYNLPARHILRLSAGW